MARPAHPRPRRLERNAMYPADLKYTKDHEWVRVDGDTGTIGITNFAQQQLGDVVYVELPEVGASLTAGQPFGTIESVKAVSELYAPVAGEVVEVNTALKDKPEDVNARPHDTWMIKVRLANAAETGSLMDAAAYQSHTGE
jgi:glycine cleavage system H protein